VRGRNIYDLYDIYDLYGSKRFFSSPVLPTGMIGSPCTELASFGSSLSPNEKEQFIDRSDLVIQLIRSSGRFVGLWQ
jgi:hypothetical protein